MQFALVKLGNDYPLSIYANVLKQNFTSMVIVATADMFTFFCIYYFSSVLKSDTKIVYRGTCFFDNNF